MTQLVTYIDGFNLYFGLRTKAWKKYYWLDLQGLSERLLKPGQVLAATHYFTARIRTNGHNSSDQQRQNTYLEALQTKSLITIHYGHYLEKTRTCRACRTQWTDYEEKMTDVNIATQLLSDAYDNNFDVALIISGDSDLTTTIQSVLRKFPRKKIIVVFPPARHSSSLTNAATASFVLGEANLRQSQFPQVVTRQDGFQLQRPAHWR
ncbi:MAG: NYN domain-containing protein [Alphaproteobacteria bacterium]|nr:NYN domain-containing protein [Alphaproteobacteria bacterium]